MPYIKCILTCLQSIKKTNTQRFTGWMAFMSPNEPTVGRQFAQDCMKWTTWQDSQWRFNTVYREFSDPKNTKFQGFPGLKQCILKGFPGGYLHHNIVSNTSDYTQKSVVALELTTPTYALKWTTHRRNTAQTHVMENKKYFHLLLQAI